jgi:hypothetical protein
MFEAFPKIPRLERACVVTEKIDGTNAQVYIVDPDTLEGEEFERVIQADPVNTFGDLRVFAGSRSRLISPGKSTDNFGFAQWVRDNTEELICLGEGRHFGEWYGSGIQRGYGLKERRFSLFHAEGIAHKPDCVGIVPVLYEGPFDTARINAAMETLWNDGSAAVPGFKNPEGIIVFHTASRTLFKKTFDDKHKEAA